MRNILNEYWVQTTVTLLSLLNHINRHTYGSQFTSIKWQLSKTKLICYSKISTDKKKETKKKPQEKEIKNNSYPFVTNQIQKEHK